MDGIAAEDAAALKRFGRQVAGAIARGPRKDLTQEDRNRIAWEARRRLSALTRANAESDQVAINACLEVLEAEQ
jgi:hypothetical protein